MAWYNNSIVKGIAKGLPGIGGLASLADAYDIPSKIADPNYDLIPGVDNPFNNSSKTTSTNTNANPKSNPDVTNPADPGQYTPSVLGTNRNNYTAADIAALEAAVARNNRLLDSLGVGRDTALRQVDSEYDKNYKRTLDDQAIANRDLNLRTRNNEDDKTAAFNKIDNSASRIYDGVMRMLGIKGAGKSSAADIVAPTLVAKQASSQRGDQMNTFNKNKEAITYAQTDTDRRYRNLLDDLLNWKNTTRNSTEQSFINNENDIKSNRASAQSQLDDARGGDARKALQDYQASFDRNQATLDALLRASVSPTYNYQAVDTTAPDTSQYSIDPEAIAMGEQAEDPTATDMNAYLPWLRRQQELGLL